MENLINAVQLVSHDAYFNYLERFQLLYKPSCMNKITCAHITKGGVSQVKEIPQHVKDRFKSEIQSHRWSEALEVLLFSVTPMQYLTVFELKSIYEIILNISKDLSPDYTISQVIGRCKLLLSVHFYRHCCINKDIRELYTQMLMSPMDLKNSKCSNRSEFGSNEGIVQFCLNRLEYELSSNCFDGPLLDRSSAPKELNQSIEGLFWQKDHLEIFEMLERPHRIERLMIVMQSVIELLQFDLAIFQFHRDSGIQMRNREPLIQSLLWRQTRDLRSISKSFKQIMKIFCYLIHLKYPEQHIKTMTLWLNIAVEMFYIFINKQRTQMYDYPKVDSRFTSLINEFYEVFADLPPKSITNILEKIEPSYLRHQISQIHSRTLLNSDIADTFKLLANFYKNAKWAEFPQNNRTIIRDKSIIEKQRPNKLLKRRLVVCKTPNFHDNAVTVYRKFYPSNYKYVKDQNYVIYTLYIALKAYLNANNIQKIQAVLEDSNGESVQESSSSNKVRDSNSPSKVFIKKYINIIKSFQELTMTIRDKITCKNKPVSLCIFERLLHLY